jgi:hypothetical protein
MCTSVSVSESDVNGTADSVIIIFLFFNFYFWKLFIPSTPLHTRVARNSTKTMTCADTIQLLIDELDAVLTSNPDACCTEFLTPDVSAIVAAIQSDCAAEACPISSPIDSNVYCVHNFDIPIHTFCELLFRKADTDVSTIKVSRLWDEAFANTDTLPPIIDTLSATSKDEYYTLGALCRVFLYYVQTAQTVNANDVGNLQNAFAMLADEERFLSEELDTLHTDQCAEDLLQDAIDNPDEAWQCAQEQTRDDVRERRMRHNRTTHKRHGNRHDNGSRHDNGNAGRTTTQSRRQAKLFVPLGRSKMGGFEHTIADARFRQTVREAENKLQTVRTNRATLDERNALAQTIQKTLQQLTRLFHTLITLVSQFLKEWEARQVACCTTTSPPLARRMTFQQQLKTTLFTAKALMRQQVFQCKWQLGEDVPRGNYAYYAYFNYAVQSCPGSVRTLPSADVVLKASNSLLLYTQQQTVLQLLLTASYLETGSVITRTQILRTVGQLMRIASVMDVV